MRFKEDDELIEILKTATNHLAEDKPWIESISSSNGSPMIIKINFNENQKVKTQDGFIGVVKGISCFKGQVVYGVLPNGWKDIIFVKADEIEAI